jgi:broad specificity phosphatase PhoE
MGRRLAKISGLALLLILGIISASCGRQQSASTIVLIVRHAEKASDAEDSSLTEAGAERARSLVRVAESAGVSAIYSTQFKRNRDTAQPLSEKLGLPVSEVPVNLQSPGDYGKTLARDITGRHAGQTVLVVGHSNTIPLIIEGLTGRPAPVSGAEYNDLFIVTVPVEGAPGLIRAQYGAGG